MVHIKFSISKKMCDSIDMPQVLLTAPLPIDVRLKVSPKGGHTFNWLLFSTAQKHSGRDMR